jgi:hypothetical protein
MDPKELDSMHGVVEEHTGMSLKNCERIAFTSPHMRRYYAPERDPDSFEAGYHRLMTRMSEDLALLHRAGVPFGEIYVEKVSPPSLEEDLGRWDPLILQERLVMQTPEGNKTLREYVLRATVEHEAK